VAQCTNFFLINEKFTKFSKNSMETYPDLYLIGHLARKKHGTVVVVLSTQPPNISWRRDLSDVKLVMWNNLFLGLTSMVLS
jgi:hypothetical protein